MPHNTTELPDFLS